MAAAPWQAKDPTFSGWEFDSLDKFPKSDRECGSAPVNLPFYDAAVPENAADAQLTSGPQ